MGRGHMNFRPCLLIPALIIIAVSAFGQSAITTPILNVQDSPSDSAALPLLQVQGGSTSSTLGTVVTSQGKSTLYSGNIFTTLAGITNVNGPGYGGLSLVQLGTQSGAGVNSPFLSLCAQQLKSNVSTPECWSFQVQGGNASDVTDVFILSRTNTFPNVTLQLPDQLNLVAGFPTTGGQLTIGAPPTNFADISAKPITLIGGFTSDGTSGAHAAPLQLFPGFVKAGSPDLAAQEGALQIGMAVRGTPTMATQYLLACYSSTQTAMPCAGATAPLLGVYFIAFAGCPANCGTGGSSAIIAPPGRAQVKSNSASSVAWPAGTPVCRDPNTAEPGLTVIEDPTGMPPLPIPCPIGQAVGVAVGDPTGTTNPHVVDLDFSDQGVGSHGNSTSVQLSDGTGSSGNLAKFDPSGNVTDSGVLATANQILNVQGNLGAIAGNGMLRDVFTYTLPANTFSASAQEIDIAWCTVHTGSSSVAWQMTIGAINHNLSGLGSTGVTPTCGTTRIATFGTFVAASAPVLIWTEAKSNFSTTWGGSVVQTNQTVDTTASIQLHLQFNVGSSDAATPQVWVVRKVGF
jgi:hypothetical protein